MQDNSFFDEVREQSQVKSRIVEKYFRAWSYVIVPQAKKGKAMLVMWTSSLVPAYTTTG